ncbi:MAG: hypothetical protein IIU14_00060 [Ruminococcus sp.]|nr:hypothetical protein [Ruminococcus sp.]
MKKLIYKTLCAVLCACVAASSAALPAGAVGTLNKDSEICEGSVIKCGKTLVTLVNNFKKNKTRIYRSKLSGKGLKLVDKAEIYSDAQLYSVGDRVYYRKGEKLVGYKPKTGKKSGGVELDPDDEFKLKDKKGFLINVKGVCANGFVVEYRGEGLCLVDFEGNRTVISPKKDNVYIASADNYVFYYKAEKKKSSRYVCGVYRYEAGAGKAEKVSSFSTIKKPSAKPDFAFAYVGKKKLCFTAGTVSSGAFEGCLYSMNRDGGQLKTVKENTSGNITPGKGCGYISCADAKGNYFIYKLTEDGKLKSKLKYTNGNYPLISYTTEKDSAVAIEVSRFNYGYNVYTLPKIKKAKGKKQFDADSRITNKHTGNVLVSPTISGSAGDLVLLTYGIYSYGSDNSLENVYDCETYLINARSGNKKLIDR